MDIFPWKLFLFFAGRSTWAPRLGAVSVGTIHAIRRGIVDVRVAMALYSLVAVSSLREPPDQVRVITTLRYRN